jgi:hypothetical protein
MEPMERTQIEQLLRSADPQGLRQLPPDELRTHLRAIFGENEALGAQVNVDKLMGLGVRLGRAGLAGLDLTAIDWLDEVPRLSRLDVVSAFLYGFWSYLPQPGEPLDGRIERFLDLGRRLPGSPEVEYGFLLAVSAALRPDVSAATGQRLQAILGASAGRDFGPILQPLVASLIARALNKPRPPP